MTESASHDPQQELKAAGGALLIAVAAFLAYLPALGGGFIWDDVVTLTENVLIQRRDGLGYIWFSVAPYDYFPVTLTSLWLEWRLWGQNPLGYHVVNVALHALNAVLLWRVLRRLRVPGAWFAALLFALHPICVASVAWITELKNTLSMVFYLLSLLWYLRCDEAAQGMPTTSGSQPAADRWGRRLRYGLSLGTFLLALLAKTSVVVLPVVLLLCSWWRRGRLTRREVLRTTPYFALSLALGLVTVWFQTHRAIGDAAGTVQGENLLQRAAAAGWALWFYLCKILVPMKLSAVYPRWDLTAASVWAFLPLALFVAVLGLAWRRRGSWGRHLFFALAYFAITLLPVLGFIDMFYLTYSRVADHWVYLSLPGIIALVVGCAWTLARRLGVADHGTLSGLLIAVVLWVTGGLGLLTLQRAGAYATEEALWRDTIRKNPAAWCAYNNLGQALLKQGEYREAKRVLEEGLRLRPASPEAHNNLGTVLDKLGQPQEALSHFEKAFQLNPRLAWVHNNWAAALIGQGKLDEATAHLRRALEIKPGYPAAHENLALVLLKQGKGQEALGHALAALEQSPENPQTLYTAGNCLFLRGDTREAVDCYAAACQRRPEYLEAHYNLAVALSKLNLTNEAAFHFAQATGIHPDSPNALMQQGILLAQWGQVQLATDQFQTAVRLRPQDAEGHNRLGFLYAKGGKFDQAIAEFTEALRLEPHSAEAHQNLGNAWLELRQPKRALPELEAALRFRPGSGVLQAQVGATLASLGKQEEAVARFNEALRLEPGNAAAHYGLANHLLKQGRAPAALEHYLSALKTRPDFAEAHYQVGIIRQAQRNFRESARHLREAVRLKPDWPEALNNLAWLLATHKDPQVRDGAEAVRLAKHALELSERPRPDRLDTLAAAYAEAGRFQQAVGTAQEAIELARKNGQAELAIGISNRLALYQKGLPYREP